MAALTTLQTLITPAPRPHGDLFKRAEITCGDLENVYQNALAPVCSGQTSICTFTNSLQGCCDSASSCQFYTSCVQGYDPATCGSQCLKCPTSAPYCTQFLFSDAGGLSYNGYSCGFLTMEGTIIKGSATSVGDVQSTSATDVSSSSLTGSSTSPSATKTSAVASNATSQSSKPHTGVIVGGAVGGAAGLALLVVAGYFLYKWMTRNDTSKTRYGPVGLPEIQQNYGDNDNSTLASTSRYASYRR